MIVVPDEQAMIRKCTDMDIDVMHEIVNDAAGAYEGVIPADRWRRPYMSKDELRNEIDDGVCFWGYEDGGRLTGIMGIQDMGDVTLIRHAYVRTVERRRGIGSTLLKALVVQTKRPVLVGTWADARWAVDFYEKHGFKLVSKDEKNRLLNTYWKIPARQVETSVVLADVRYFESHTR
jgi:N-acetylglutamate synthase-like GNAT family acetyltransferase